MKCLSQRYCCFCFSWVRSTSYCTTLNRAYVVFLVKASEKIEGMLLKFSLGTCLFTASEKLNPGHLEDCKVTFSKTIMWMYSVLQKLNSCKAQQSSVHVDGPTLLGTAFVLYSSDYLFSCSRHSISKMSSSFECTGCRVWFGHTFVRHYSPELVFRIDTTCRSAVVLLIMFLRVCLPCDECWLLLQQLLVTVT